MKNRFENVYAIDKNNNKFLTKEEYEKELERIEELITYEEGENQYDNLLSIDKRAITLVFDEDYTHEITEDGKIGSSEKRYKSKYNTFLGGIGQLVEFDQGRKVVYSDRNFTLSEMEEIHLNYDSIGDKLPYHSLNEIASIICDEIEENKEKENER